MNIRNIGRFNLEALGVLVVTLSATSLAPAQTLEFQSDSGNLIHIMPPPAPPSTPSTPTPLSPRFAVTASNLVYGGGPVMRNPTNYIIFWQPPGQSGIPGWLHCRNPEILPRRGRNTVLQHKHAIWRH